MTIHVDEKSVESDRELIDAAWKAAEADDEPGFAPALPPRRRDGEA